MLRNLHCVTDSLLKLALGLFFSDNDASGWVIDDWPDWVMLLLYYIPTCHGMTHISVILYGIYLEKRFSFVVWRVDSEAVCK